MLIYIKDRKTFKTVGMTQCVDWDIVEDSDTAEFSSFTLPPGTLGFGDVGQWIIAEGTILRVDMVTPTAEQTTVRCLPAWTVFNLDTEFNAEAAHPATVETFVANTIAADYIAQPDTAYRMAYLSVTAEASTPFTAPETVRVGTFTLSDYIVATGVALRFTVSRGTLNVHVSARPAAARNLIFGDGRSIVTSQAYSADAVAKVTTVQDGTKRTYYLATDGAVSTSPPGDRPEGSWIYVSVGTKDDPLEKARAEFAKNKSAHKIEFMSAHDLAVGDVVTARLDGRVFTGAVSRRGNSSAAGAMKKYAIGDLAVTASEKLRRI